MKKFNNKQLKVHGLMQNTLAVDHEKLLYGSLNEGQHVAGVSERKYIRRCEKENIMGQRKKPTNKRFYSYLTQK